LLGALLLSTYTAQSQIAAWDLTGESSPATSAADVFNGNLSSSNTLTRGTGASASGASNSFRTQGFQNNGISTSNTDYFQVTLKASTGYTVSLSTIDAKFNGTTTFAASPGVSNQFAYSLDGSTFTLIGSAQVIIGTSTPLTQIDLSSITALQNVPEGTTITLRYYASGQTTSGGWGFYSASAGSYGLAIGGTVATAIPPTVNTFVQFNSPTGVVNEDAALTVISLIITDPSPTDSTKVYISYVDPNGRIDSLYSPVAIAPNATTGQAIVTIHNDALCNGDEGIHFMISNVTGGQGSPSFATNDPYVLLVHDDDVLVAPTATDPAIINANDFTATWNPASAATGYQLDVSTSPTFSTPGPLTTNEGFNSFPTTPPAGWTFSGVTSYTSTGSSGLLPNSLKFDTDGDQVISPLLVSPASSLSFWILGNGTNALSALLVEGYNGTDWSTIDNISSLPATGTTKSYSGLSPSNYVQFRFTYSKSAGNLAFDDVSYTCLCGTSPSFLSGYENLSVTGTSQSVTGLDAHTDYYYRVRAVGGGCPTTDNSNVIHVTTAVGTSPLLTAGSLADFGAICRNATAGPFSFTINGVNLTAANVTVAPLEGFTFSTQEAGVYTTSLSIAQPGGSFSQDIWVMFSPTAVQTYAGSIMIVGGGADAIVVAATGSGIETPPSLTTGTATNMGLDQDEVAGTIDAEGCFAITAYGIEYSSTENFTLGSGTQVASTNAVAGAFTSELNGLSPCSTYWYRAYATNSEGTAYGEEDSFSTPTMVAPVAAPATTVGIDNFMATWGPVAGASGYFLDVSDSPTFGSANTTTDLFISEYVEGSSNNKYIEIYNGTGVPVDLSDYKLRLYTNGATSPGNDVALSGSLANGSTIVYKNTSASAYTGAATINAAVSFNGDDAVALFKVSTNANVDIFGRIGEDPGSAWTASSGYSTVDHTLVRRSSVTGGVTTNPSSGFPTLATEWDVFNMDDVSHLGTHGFVLLTPSFVNGYNDLSVAGTSQSVTGLDPSTEYYYRVRAGSATCEPINSNTISVTTHDAVPTECTGNKVVVAIHTDANGDQTTWEIRDAGNTVVASGGPYTGQNNMLVTDTVCLGTTTADACYSFTLFDSFGDGLGASGGWQLRTTTGKVLLEDSFEDGSVSPATPQASATYGSGHSFCLPEGNCKITANECGVYTNLLGNKVYCDKITGATQYQFEFSDPDAGFIRRITVSTNYVHFGDMVTNPLTPGVHYFCRVRTNKFGPLATAHFGSGCDMGLSVSGVVACTELISAPAYGHSCNESRPFHSNGYIYAIPVQGATQYQFHIYNTGSGYDTTITRNTYILALSWGPRPMVNGTTYNVEINVTVNGVQTGFCPSSCTITIDNGEQQFTGGQQYAARSLAITGVHATLWPNPTNNGHVNLVIDDLAGPEQQITVDIRDLYGRQVYAQDIGNSGDTFNTILELPNDVSSGIYLVNLTINGEASVYRLSVIR